MISPRLLLLAVLVGTATLARAAAPSAAAVASVLAAPDPLAIDGEALDGERLRGLYGQRANVPLWGGDAERAGKVAGVLADAGTHGLEPAQYHAGALARRAAPADERAAAERDVLLTDGLMRYAVDVHFGRAVPLHRNDQVDIPPRPIDPAAIVAGLAAAPDLGAALDHLPPAHPAYARLRTALARLRQLPAQETWPALPDGSKLTDAMAVALRPRLVVLDALPPQQATTASTAAVRAALLAFQTREGLTPDGLVGKGTRERFATVPEMIDRVIANLERWRWFPDDLGARHVEVNVADFSLRLVEQGATTLEAPVIVGQPDWTTPIVSSRIEQLTYNPAWNVPPGIARKEMLGKVRANPEYLEHIGIHVRHRGGDAVDSTAVDWASTGIGGFVLMQPPGPTNPLGRVKFNFPNVNGVYLHDTNKRALFRNANRALSHGCIRVGNAIGLAEQILRDTAWTPERQKTLMKDWKTRWVPIAAPVPVHITYQTAWADEQGILHVRGDIYSRDAALLEAMRRPQPARVTAYAPPPPPPAAPTTDSNAQQAGAPPPTAISATTPM